MVPIKENRFTLPFRYIPRDYQLPLWEAFDSGLFRRFIQVWHRRAGKDRTDLNLAAREMQKKIGVYYYFFPTYSQGRKALWEGIGKDGMRYIEHFPKELIEKRNDTEMKVYYKNGSIFQIIGTDDIDKVVGTNPIGVIFSEYSLQNPKAWDFIRPILLENEGWAIFNFTPRGKNHAFKLYEMAKNNIKWFVSLLTIRDTKILTEEHMQEERDAGMLEEMIQQEYYCSFTSAIIGSYYWEQYDWCERNKRFGTVPWEPALPVHTVWDLGVGDSMVIGFFQLVGKEVRMIRYYEDFGKGLDFYVKYLQKKKYVYGKHFAPHDIKVREMTTGKSRLETAISLGIDFEVVPDIGVQNGIDAARMLFKRLWVDNVKCEKFLELIPQYTKEYDEERKVFKNTPFHDWTSHGADMFRYAAVVVDQMSGPSPRQAHVFIPDD